jgi:ABC-2 type transport system permease protein
MTEILLLVWRSLQTSVRMPAAVIPNVAISIFFLFVFNSGLSSVANLPGFKGSYLAFIIPVSIVSASVGGAGTAGQMLVRDIESGYFTKLLLTPASRLALVWGPMIAAAIVLVGQVVLILVLGIVLGLRAAAGVGGFLLVLFFAFLWGMAFAGYAVAIALKTKNGAAAQAATFAFFPLIFLSTTFVPRQYITATWLKWAATINPTTYVYDAMRSLLIDGWSARPLLIGFGVMLAFSTLTGVLALRQARRATQLG